jgi:hypothetical protein
MIGQSKTKTAMIEFILFELAGSQLPAFRACFLPAFQPSSPLPKLHANANRAFSIKPFKWNIPGRRNAVLIWA